MRHRFAISLIPLLLVIGCTRGPSFAQVSGKVTRGGKPLAEASVGFQPNASMNPGPGSYGRTDAEGNYALKVVTTDDPGAVVGPHKVFVTPGGGKTRDSKDDRAIGYQKPIPFAFTVPPEGTNSANFDIPDAPKEPKDK